MYNRFSILIASICLSFFVATPVFAGQQETTKLVIKDEGEAPKFEYIDDINETRSPKFSSHKLTAVHFWATWCVPCIDELPMVDDTQDIFRGSKLIGGDDFKVVVIAIDGRNMSKVKLFFHDKKIEHLDAYLDPTQKMPKLAKLPGLPGTLFVNSKGVIVARADGPLDWQSTEVQKFLKSQLK
jgi:thiol-disulfide isomerase/thioredoxin